ncbi:MAG: LytR C-terminal domain-containing protein [Acidimicrobiales bacterium]
MSAPTSPPTESSPGSHYQPSLGVVLVILVLFVGGAFIILRSPGAATSPSVTTTTLHPRARATTTKLPSRASVRVQVANSTSVAGLAGNYSQKLTTLGWDVLPALNASKVAATIIYFKPGFRWAALEIAAQIKISQSAAQPLGHLVPVPNAAGDDIIVILGPDAAIIG